jgi:hypothetical protein
MGKTRESWCKEYHLTEPDNCATCVYQMWEPENEHLLPHLDEGDIVCSKMVDDGVPIERAVISKVNGPFICKLHMDVSE